MKYVLMALMVVVWLGAGCQKTRVAPNGVEPAGDSDVVTPSSDDGGEAIADEDPAEPDNTQQAPAPKGKLKDGKKHGPWVFFHENGKKAAQGEYLDGFKHGRWTFWYDNEKKTAQGEYKNGNKDGKWTGWDESGQLVSERQYRDGEEIF